MTVTFNGKDNTRRVGWVGLLILSGLLGGCPLTSPDGSDGSALVYRDDFDSTTLEAGWAFAGADPTRWSLTARSGYLRVLPEPLAENPDETQDSLMLREQSGDFILVTLMEFETLEDRQVAGLVIEGDDGRQVTLVLTSASAALGTFRGLFMAADRGPDVPEGRANEPFDDEAVHLRLERRGDSYTGSFSTDGVTFTPVGTLSNNLSDAVRVGVGTAKGRSCVEDCMQSIEADFDYFEIRRATAP